MRGVFAACLWCALVPAALPMVDGSTLQLTCGLLDLAPLLTQPEHFGAISLLAEHGPMDVTCRRVYQSRWLMHTCDTLAPTLQRLDTNIEMLNSICWLGSRKVRRALWSCSGIDPQTHRSALAYMARSRAAKYKSDLFCSFIADCSLHAYLTACVNGLPLIQRLIDTCASGPTVEALAGRCVANPSYNVTTAAAGSSLQSLEALTQAFGDALDVRERLRPFVNVKVGLLEPAKNGVGGGQKNGNTVDVRNTSSTENLQLPPVAGDATDVAKLDGKTPAEKGEGGKEEAVKAKTEEGGAHESDGKVKKSKKKVKQRKQKEGSPVNNREDLKARDELDRKKKKKKKTKKTKSSKRPRDSGDGGDVDELLLDILAL